MGAGVMGLKSPIYPGNIKVVIQLPFKFISVC
jgi:hypothetical protein